jgi:hypothetical protein
LIKDQTALSIRFIESDFVLEQGVVSVLLVHRYEFLLTPLTSL